MKICLIAEGSYPYVTGGVSSWIQMLINQMPEHEFIIYSIGAESKLKGNFSYDIPHNVTLVSEFFLDNILLDEGKFGKNYSIDDVNIRNIENLITGEGDVNFQQLFSLFRNKKIKTVSDFFMSRDFFNVVMSSYEKKYATFPFTEYFWTIRSMLLPLLYIINNDIPDADLYHSVSTGYAGIIGSLANFIYNKPFILTEHGIYTREREEEIIKATFVKGYFKDMWIGFFTSLSKCAYSCATEVITLFNKNKLIEIDLGCSADKIKIIPNGINIDNYQYSSVETTSNNVINIGAIVRVVPIKDIKTMLQSFLIVSNEIKNCNFYVMGPTDEDEDYYNECLSLLDTFQIENVQFTGKVNVKEYLNKMDILVLSSISEGQPLAILEGMAAKKPFVTTDVGSCSELIYGLNDDYGPAGIVVPIMNYVKMGNALVELCKDKDLRTEMGLNGYKRVSKFYTLDKFIEGYKKIYGKYEVK